MDFKKIYYTISVLLFIGAGDYIGYWVAVTKKTGNLITVLGIIAVAMIFYGFFCLAILFGMLFPFLNKPKRNVNVLARNALNAFFTIVYITLVVVSVIPYFYFTRKYKADQLKRFGVSQRVSIEYSESKYVSFHFFTPDSVYDGELPCENYSAGDSATIIYSSDDPNVVVWGK